MDCGLRWWGSAAFLTSDESSHSHPDESEKVKVLLLDN